MTDLGIEPLAEYQGIVCLTAAQSILLCCGDDCRHQGAVCFSAGSREDEEERGDGAQPAEMCLMDLRDRAAKNNNKKKREQWAFIGNQRLIEIWAIGLEHCNSCVTIKSKKCNQTWKRVKVCLHSLMHIDRKGGGKRRQMCETMTVQSLHQKNTIVSKSSPDGD